MKRNYSIDTLRTIATLLVILLHVSVSYIKEDSIDNTFGFSFWAGNIINSFCRVCVPVFVIISGMFLIGREESIGRFYKKRMNRIIIPIIFWSIFYFLYQIFLPMAVGAKFNLNSLLLDVIQGKPFYHMWYLFMILGLYLVTPLINKSIKNISYRMLWKIAFLLSLLGFFNSAYNDWMGNKVFFMFWFVNYLGYFLLGYLIKNSMQKLSNRGLFLLYVFCSLAIAIVSYFTLKYHNSLYFYGFLTPIVFLASISLTTYFNQLKLNENLFSKMTHLTFGVYLVHAVVLNLIDIIFQNLNLLHILNPIVEIMLIFSLTSIISILIVWIINKIPYLKQTI